MSWEEHRDQLGQPFHSARNNQNLKGLVQFTGLPRWLSGKEPACQRRRHKRRRFLPRVGKIPWRRKWQPTPVLLSGKSHKQRSLVGYSPWGCKESDATKVTKHALLLSSHAHTRHPLKAQNSAVQVSPLVPEHCPHSKNETPRP